MSDSSRTPKQRAEEIVSKHNLTEAAYRDIELALIHAQNDIHSRYDNRRVDERPVRNIEATVTTGGGVTLQIRLEPDAFKATISTMVRDEVRRSAIEAAMFQRNPFRDKKAGL